MTSELVIYTDESDKDGAYFSNFYGGVLVRANDLETATDQLQACKSDHNLHGEIKWQKVTSNYLEKYTSVMNVFFDLIEADLAKVRIMFTDNKYVAQGLTSEHRQATYHILYYQFIKHAFGLQFCGNEHPPPIHIRLNLDQMPTSNEDTAQFKSYIVGLNRNPRFRSAGISFDERQIAEVDSRKHVLLQCLDIVLGSIVFRLNNKHKIQPGQTRRGKRTIAKEKLYKFINTRIRNIYPNFNIGISTGHQGDLNNFWNHPYRHWLFIPKNHKRDNSKAKP